MCAFLLNKPVQDLTYRLAFGLPEIHVPRFACKEDFQDGQVSTHVRQTPESANDALQLANPGGKDLWIRVCGSRLRPLLRPEGIFRCSGGGRRIWGQAESAGGCARSHPASDSRPTAVVASCRCSFLEPTRSISASLQTPPKCNYRTALLEWIFASTVQRSESSHWQRGRADQLGQNIDQVLADFAGGSECLQVGRGLFLRGQERHHFGAEIHRVEAVAVRRGRAERGDAGGELGFSLLHSLEG